MSLGLLLGLAGCGGPDKAPGIPPASYEAPSLSRIAADASDPQAKQTKVQICHHPGNGSHVIIEVSESAVAAHFRNHGDSYLPCPGAGTTTGGTTGSTTGTGATTGDTGTTSGTGTTTGTGTTDGTGTTTGGTTGDASTGTGSTGTGSGSGDTGTTTGGSTTGGSGSTPPPDVPSSEVSFGASVEFLYNGPNAVQTGVVSGAIKPNLASVLRGKVLDGTGAPLPGVQVKVLGHPEWGQSQTRATTGEFDLVVNGGARKLTVVYSKAGYITAQRNETVDWNRYGILPDVVLMVPDAPVAVNMAQGGMRVAQASPVTDSDGTRRSTLLIPDGCAATMILPDPDGSGPLTPPQQALSGTIEIRQTENSVGPLGEQSMPADIAFGTGYMHCYTFSVDQAEQAGAVRVNFSPPLVHYNVNYLNLATGVSMPTGYYDAETGLWVPTDNGRVIKILSVTAGMANLDLNGDGAADPQTALDAMGITPAEQTQLALLYAPGTSLVRTPTAHFTVVDGNCPIVPPLDAVTPKPKKKKKCKCPCPDEDDPEATTLDVPAEGTGQDLHYSSPRTPGAKFNNEAKIEVSGPTLPASCKGIEVELEVAGKQVKASLPADPNQTFSHVWDQKDVYGRTVQGSQPATFRVGYRYPGTYADGPPGGLRTFGLSSGVPLPGETPSRQDYIAWSVPQTLYLGSFDPRGSDALGGFTLPIHHTYLPTERVLQLGTGQTVHADVFGNTLNRIAGGGTSSLADGIPARLASIALQRNQSLVIGPDRATYFTSSNRVWRVDPDTGLLSVVAGTGPGGTSGDGGPATAATLDGATQLAFGPDGSLYVMTGNVAVNTAGRLRKIGTDGIITTVAGNGAGSPIFGGDGGPASNAVLSNSVADIEVSPSGNVYIAEAWRVRVITSDGTIRTVAGTNPGFSGDGGPALQAAFRNLGGICLAPDGSLYVCDSTNSRVRKIGPDGIVSTVAGNGSASSTGDGGLATQASLQLPSRVCLANGILYIAENGDSNNVNFHARVVRAVDLNGTIRRAAGDPSLFLGQPSGLPDGKLPLQNGVGDVVGLESGPDQSPYLVCGQVLGGVSMYRMDLPLPDWGSTDLVIPSSDGSMFYRFTASGRHLETVNALTNATIYTFGYDSSGRLVTATDSEGNVTSIERDQLGNPTAVVGPFGQRTTLATNADGFLASVTSPGGRMTRMSYSPDGLLTGVTDPKGNPPKVMTYDTDGHNEGVSSSGGSAVQNTTVELPNGEEVTETTAMGRSSRTRHEVLSDGTTRMTMTATDGTVTVTEQRLNGTIVTTWPDGTTTTVTYQADPRWGMSAPFAASKVTSTGGLTATSTTSRSVVLTTPPAITSINQSTETTVFNGRTSTSNWNAGTRVLVETSPAGRSVTTTYSPQGRLLTTSMPGLATVTRSYNARGQLASVVEGSGSGARTTNYAYAANGYLASVTDALNRTISFTRDADGRVTATTLPDGRVVGASYDENSNLLTLTPPGRPAHSFSYTSRDLTEQYTPPTAIPSGPTSYQYNADAQPVSTNRPDGEVVSSAYDLAGRLQTLTIPRGSFEYSYDGASGKLTSVTGPGNSSRSYSYQGLLLASLGSGGPVAGSAAWTYDNNYRPTGRTLNGANGIAFNYDADNLATAFGSLALTRNTQNGLLTGTTLGSITDTLTYSAFAEVSAYTASAGSSQLYSESYLRDNLGRITQLTETIQGTTTTWAYSYENSGRLSIVTRNGAPFESYIYDANGNRLTRVSAAGTTIYGTDDQDRLLSAVGTSGAQSWMYDSNGDLVQCNDSTGQTSFDYDTTGQLLNVTKPNGNVVSYELDAWNKRATKKINGVVQRKWLYAGGLLPVAEYDANDNLTAVFNGAYMVKNGNTYRLVRDHLGSVRLVVDAATGTVAQRLSYGPFGEVLEDTSPGFQPFGYAGGLYDPDTGLVRFGARDYDSNLGRWTCKDPIALAGGRNLYSYCANNPVNLTDASGKVFMMTRNAESLMLLGELGSQSGLRPNFKVSGDKYYVTFTGEANNPLAKWLSIAQGVPWEVNFDASSGNKNYGFDWSDPCSHSFDLKDMAALKKRYPEIYKRLLTHGIAEAVMVQAGQPYAPKTDLKTGLVPPGPSVHYDVAVPAENEYPGLQRIGDSGRPPSQLANPPRNSAFYQDSNGQINAFEITGSDADGTWQFNYGPVGP